MSKIRIFTGLFLAILLFAAGCKKKNATQDIMHSPFHQRISAFTSGLIPTDGNIVVEFTDTVPAAVPGNEVASSLVSISPKLQGKWTWFDNKTMRFVPAAKLQPDKKWQVTVNITKMYADEKDNFFFEFATLPQNFRVTTDALQMLSPDNATSFKQTGRIAVADGVEDKSIESMLTARHNGKNVEIKWQHTDSKIHLFEISPLSRLEKASELEISYNGNPIGVSEKGVITVAIPSINEFSVQSVQVVQSPRQLVRVVFSEIGRAHV